MHAIVIGGGFGGIASALRVRAKGYDVTLLDRCQQLGGRAQCFERNGFRHDAGPTVITAPFLFEELFALFGEKLSDHIDLIPLNPWYRFEYADGTYFDYGGTVEQTIAEITRIEPSDADGYVKLLAHSKRIFDIGFTELSATPFNSLWFMLKQLPSLVRLESYKTVWQLVTRYLRNDKLRQAFSIQPLLVGGNPFDTTSIYSLIHYLERSYGVHFPMGGTHAVVVALEQLMARQGIAIKLNTTVKSLNVAGTSVHGVTLDTGEIINADIVISDADPSYLYRHMVDQDKQPYTTRFKAKKSKFSMGLYVLFFGTTQQYPHVAHHTIWLGARYKELLQDIFDRKILSNDFSLYIHRPTATDPSFAPLGCDSFYVLCPVPNLQGGQDWAVEGPKLRNQIVAALDRSTLPNLKDTITDDFYMTPHDFERDYLSVHGAGFSISPLFSQSAWFRFHNKAEGLKNLYLVGAGTHPGAGLPGVISSAKVVDSLIPSIAARV
jgi:phytoene desaturase